MDTVSRRPGSRIQFLWQIDVAVSHYVMQCFVGVERFPAEGTVRRGNAFEVGVDCVLGGGRVEELTDIGSADALGEEFEDLLFAGARCPARVGSVSKAW